MTAPHDALVAPAVRGMARLRDLSRTEARLEQ
jgi:hypothetical protein